MTHISGHDRSQILLLPEVVDDYVGPDNPVGIVNLRGRGMLLVSVARQLGSGNSFARLLCCPAQAERAGKRRPRSAKLTMPFPSIPYHNSAAAHDRMMGMLPPGSPYHRATGYGLVASLAVLWRNAR
jgi:hypothetical protein